MTELVSEGAVFWGAGAVSIAGIVLCLYWWRRQGSVGFGPVATLVALTLPLWLLFRVIDEWLDTVTVRGMLTPYVVMILIGWVLGKVFLKFSRRTGES